jgi:PAS domain S-box-containing protein
MATNPAGESGRSAIPTAQFVMDGRGRVVEWDSGAEQIFEWTRDQAVGQVLSELIIPERYRAIHEAGLQRFKATGKGAFVGRTIQIEVIDRSGREFPIEITISMESEGGRYRFPTVARLPDGKKPL